MSRVVIREQPVDVVELEDGHVTVATIPVYAPPVTLHVVRPPYARRWVVARDEHGDRAITFHSHQAAAVGAAIRRARRYAAAYAINRQVVSR